MTPQLQATLAKLPTKPGVYLLKDDRSRVLYVGKAQSLRNRVRQYWSEQYTPHFEHIRTMFREAKVTLRSVPPIEETSLE